MAQLLPKDRILFDALRKQVKRFETGEISIDDFFTDIIDTYLPVQFLDTKDENNTGKWSILMNVLKLVGDPERRATLQLRYYNRFPILTATICCRAEICFRCKSYWHSNQTCAFIFF